jgi:hypothetical protein
MTRKGAATMNWSTVLKKKRQRLVHAMVKARAQSNDQAEHALITLIGQLGEFETEFQKHLQMNKTEQDVIIELAPVVRKHWPVLWSDIAGSLYGGSPDEWLGRSYVVIGVNGIRIPTEGQENVTYESRVNQLEALPVSVETVNLVDTIIDTLWENLQPHVEESKQAMPHWEYAARMNHLSKRLFALYNKVQLDAIAAVRKAEEVGQLKQIGTEDK